ncbi:MAG: GntR family transcriptional regulator [Alphaproteobacteria bacterium]|nr:GntR family transcriptional regulator [Alphaproteobacteria bacterium]
MKQMREADGAKLAPVRRQTLHETAYAEIRNALTSGRMKMGESLTLRSLAAALGISETPVRRLVTEGALEAVPNRSISVPVMTRAKLAEQRQVRVTLEGLATEMAVGSLSPADIKHLAALDRQMMAAGKAGDTETVLARNSDFHMALYRASRSELLVDLIEITWLRAGPLLTLVDGRPEMMKNAKSAHRNLLAALKSRDAKAARAALAQDINTAAEQLDAVLSDNGDG